MAQRDETAAAATGGGNSGSSSSVLSLSSNLGAAAKSIQMVACGRQHTMALTRGGQIWCWGSNEDGQCGIGLLNEIPTTTTTTTTTTNENTSAVTVQERKQHELQKLQDQYFPHAQRAQQAATASSTRSAR